MVAGGENDGEREIETRECRHREEETDEEKKNNLEKPHFLQKICV